MANSDHKASWLFPYMVIIYFMATMLQRVIMYP